MTTQEDMQNVEAAIANSVMSVSNADKVMGSWARLKARLNEAHARDADENAPDA